DAHGVAGGTVGWRVPPAGAIAAADVGCAAGPGAVVGAVAATAVGCTGGLGVNPRTITPRSSSATSSTATTPVPAASQAREGRRAAALSDASAVSAIGDVWATGT